MAWSDAARAAAREARRRRAAGGRRDYGYLTHYIGGSSGSVKISEVPVGSAKAARRLTAKIARANPGDAAHFMLRLRRKGA